jgi:hypothetical protein
VGYKRISLFVEPIPWDHVDRIGQSDFTEAALADAIQPQKEDIVSNDDSILWQEFPQIRFKKIPVGLE